MSPTRFHIVHVVPDPKLHGLYGYREVIETLRWGLASLGHPTTVATNAFSAGCVNIVLGFQMLPDAELDRAPPDTIVYNFEQLAGIATDSLKPAYRMAARRFLVWDYSEHNLATWAALDPARKAVHVPVGWAPILTRIPRDMPQDIDVLFYGVPGQRRLAVYSQLCQTGVSCVFACGLYGASRDSLIARAKLVLNLDLNDARRVFEIVRVSYLLANGKAVVAARHPHTLVEQDLRDAVAFSAPHRLPATCLELLANEALRRRLEARGEQAIRARDIRAILGRALEATSLAAR